MIMANEYLNSLKKKEADLLNKLGVIQELILEEESNINKNEKEASFQKSTENLPSRNNADMGSTDAEKFLNVLKANQRFMKVKEIAEYLSTVTGESYEDCKRKMTRKTKELQDLGKIIKYMVGKGPLNVYWGSPSWIDNSKNIKPSYMYDKSTLTKTKKNALDDIDL